MFQLHFDELEIDYLLAYDYELDALIPEAFSCDV